MAVGEQKGADGTTPTTGRQGKTGEAIVAGVRGKLYESSSRGRIWNACDQGSGVAPGTALGTTALLSLYNPLNSQFMLVVSRVALGYISGTLGAGTIYHCQNPLKAGTAAPAVPTGGTGLTAYPSAIGMQTQPIAVGQVRVGSTVTTPIALRPFCSLQASLASTAVAPWQILEDTEGEFIIMPGYCYQLQAVAAGGSTPLVSPGISWEEVPIV